MTLSLDDTVKIKSSVTLEMLHRFGIEVDIRPYELTVYAVLSKKHIKAYNEDVANGYDYTIPIDWVDKTTNPMTNQEQRTKIEKL